MHHVSMMTFALVLFLTPCVQAQDNDDKSAIKKELETFIRSFEKDYVSFPKSKDKEALFSYFAPEVTSNIFVFNISGKSRVTNSSLKGFDAYLSSLLRAPKVDLKYNINNIAFTHIADQTATLVYTVDYETKEDKGIWVKGKETVSMALEKSKEDWKIVHYTILQVEDEKLKGTCLCELFVAEGEDGEVIAKTTIPVGRTYNTKFDNFEFKMSGKDQLIKVGDVIFKRASTGELFVVELKSDKEVSVGVTGSKKETVLTILRDYLYKESCTRLRVK
ncbi:MAG: nuclear transport factor 2 family protein [Bacteroidia bacterium]|nr:nuclear transport factor 2 family protein [Bacteroidia bacterium]